MPSVVKKDGGRKAFASKKGEKSMGQKLSSGSSPSRDISKSKCYIVLAPSMLYTYDGVHFRRRNHSFQILIRFSIQFYWTNVTSCMY